MIQKQTPVISVLRRQKQDSSELGYIVRLCLNKQNYFQGQGYIFNTHEALGSISSTNNYQTMKTKIYMLVNDMNDNS